MNNTNKAVSVPAAIDGKAEVLPTLASVESRFEFNGDVVTLRKGEKYTPADFEVLITSRINNAEGVVRSATTQSVYALHAAGLVSNETKAEVVKRLKNALSSVAVANLVSLANYVPMVIANGIKTPLTVLKDAIGGLKENPNLKDSVIPTDKSGKIIKSKLNATGKKLLEAVQTGLIEGKPATQAAIRALRAMPSVRNIGSPTGTSNPLTPGEQAANSAIYNAKAMLAELDKAEWLDGAKRQEIMTLGEAIARKLGIFIQAGAPRIPVPSVATVQAAQKK